MKMCHACGGGDKMKLMKVSASSSSLSYLIHIYVLRSEGIYQGSSIIRLPFALFFSHTFFLNTRSLSSSTTQNSCLLNQIFNFNHITNEKQINKSVEENYGIVCVPVCNGQQV
jgi:hypothetical protein